MSVILKISGAALLAVCVSVFFNERHRDISVAVCTCAGIVIISGVVGCAEQIIGFIKDVTAGNDASSYVPVLLKAVGFTILTEISVGICKTAGEEAIAVAVGIAGRCEIILLSLPYVKELVGVALGMLKR